LVTKGKTIYIKILKIKKGYFWKGALKERFFFGALERKEMTFLPQTRNSLLKTNRNKNLGFTVSV
jgi:hypothetical protein